MFFSFFTMGLKISQVPISWIHSRDHLDFTCSLLFLCFLSYLLFYLSLLHHHLNLNLFLHPLSFHLTYNQTCPLHRHRFCFLIPFSLISTRYQTTCMCYAILNFNFHLSRTWFGHPLTSFSNLSCGKSYFMIFISVIRLFLCWSQLYLSFFSTFFAVYFSNPNKHKK